jgi:hypothetical protein
VAVKVTLKTISSGDQNLKLIQDAIQKAFDQVRTYQAKKPSNWAGSAPTTVEDAIDRMASLLVTLNGGNAIP